MKYCFPAFGVKYLIPAFEEALRVNEIPGSSQSL
jgi:hypothetical protein